MDDYERALANIPASHETLLIVNGSRDGSYDLCCQLAERLPDVRTVLEAQPGWGRAVRRGLGEARGQLLCYTNSARTAAQDLVLLLIYGMANPGVVVKADRKIRDSWPRRLGSLLYNLECRALFDLSYWDINGTPKVFPGEFAPLRQLTRDDDLIDLEFNVMCRRQGYRVLEVPILSSTRHGGRSTTSLGSALKLYAGAYRASRGGDF